MLFLVTSNVVQTGTDPHAAVALNAPREHVFSLFSSSTWLCASSVVRWQIGWDMFHVGPMEMTVFCATALMQKTGGHVFK